jgi:hypothetical protein
MWGGGWKTAQGEAADSPHRGRRGRRTVLERPTGEGESPVVEPRRRVAPLLSTTGHEESGGKPGRPLPKAQYLPRPIVDKYREGKVKSTPGGE